MHNTRHILIAAFLLAFNIVLPTAAKSSKQPVYKNPKAPIAERVNDLLGRMTLHEKVLQLQNRGLGPRENIANDFKGYSVGSVHEMNLPAADAAQTLIDLQKYMRDSTRLGIPVITCAEGIQGIIQDGCTLFPHALAQASTWNPLLVQQMTYAAGAEAKAIGIHQILSPVFDIARELRWGRIEETFGEDPFLIAEMGIAFVKGYQQWRISCMPKHFVAHGSPSGGLNCASVAGGERDLQSLYLYPFRRVIAETQPLSVMTAYSAYDGVPVTGSYRLLTDVLRGQLGFKGYVYSDWGSVDRLMTFHHAVATREEAAAQALRAGVDIDVDSDYETLEQQVLDGTVDMTDIDLAVSRVLTVKMQLGLFDEPYGDVEETRRVVRSEEHVALAKAVADESAVLLENNGILPLDMNRYKSIALIGPNMDQAVLGDYAWTRPNTREARSLYDVLKQKWGDNHTINYAMGCDWWSQNDENIADAVAATAKSDLAIVAIGTRSTYLGRSPDKSTAGEGFDLSSLELPGRQLDLVKAVKATSKPVVVVFISGKPLAMPWVKANADAVVCQWYCGEQQSESMADILTGVVNPSGKLNVSFPQSTGNTPCFYNHYPTDREEPFDAPGSIDDPKLHYVFEAPEPLWNFGHGKSYTTFSYEKSVLSDSVFTSTADTLVVDVTVRNTGECDGKEVVQLYVRDLMSTVSTPKQQLKAFQKLLVRRGDSAVFRLRLPIDELSLYDKDMKRVVEPGEFEIQIGRASDDILFTHRITYK